ncbi:MAG TPA: ATP-binding protein [Opitutaceae bacterium]|nr:ATP-binding protein [Opitutaceae bacterium]
MGEFWSVPEGDKQKPRPLRLEVTVYFYDGLWKVLWGESGGVPCFLPVAGTQLVLKAGQRVLLEGTVTPALGISGDDLRVTVLAENALPEPRLARGMLEKEGYLNAHWVTIEGWVCRQTEIDATHLQFDVLTEGRLITAWMLLGATEPVPQLTNLRVRMNGAYISARDPAGRLDKIQFWMPRRSDLVAIDAGENDASFQLPRTPIEQLATHSVKKGVRVAGLVHSREADSSLTLRDESGQVIIATQQPNAFEPGDAIEVVGYPSGESLSVTLRDPFVRATREAATREPPQPAALLKLRMVGQVLELPLEDAERGTSVFLRGVVTWSDPAADFFYLQDPSGGIRVRSARGVRIPPIGTSITVTGVSSKGDFAPEVDAREIGEVGIASLPSRRTVSIDQALTGRMEGQFVEMRGYLRATETEGPWLRLDLTAAGGEFTAYATPDPRFSNAIGAVVRVAGICAATANTQRQLTGVRLWLPGFDALQIEAPRPANPFATPLRTVDSLKQFVGFHAIDHRVRIAGVVLHHVPGRYFYLQEENAGLLVLCREPARLAPGEWIEVVGFPGREAGRLVLREGAWQKISTGVARAPLTFEGAPRLAAEADGRLVRVRGRLQQAMVEGGGGRLLFPLEGGIFEARLDHVLPQGLPRVGSLLELTGVYVLEYDEYRKPRTFRLQLRSIDDIRLIAAPSWWTAQRALAIAGGMALCTLMGSGWVVVLRRRVRKQTAEIRQQLAKETRLHAELERAVRLESLGVLAGGIAHDFNNLLTVVIGNIGLARRDLRVREIAGESLAEAENGAKRAAELTSQLLTFSKGGDPVRSAVSLQEVVGEAAKFARYGSNVRCDLEIAENLPAANVDRGQIGRVVHNLVLNAAQAMPQGGVIRIGLEAVTVLADEVLTLADGNYLKLTVADNGTGIAPENLQRIFDPYFSTKEKNSGLGLATVRSIVKKHQGHITVDSAPGCGTTFSIWLPAASGPAVVAASVPARMTPPRRARVLFMDDEEPIRRVGAGLLRQLGHEVTLVSDGADAVRTYDAARAMDRPFDVVVLDLTVPGGMGGKAAMEALRRLDPQVRGIVSSGYSSDPVLANYRAYGFSAAVPKPYEVEVFAAAIHSVMNGEPPQIEARV